MTKKELIEALEPYDDDIEIWRYDSTILTMEAKMVWGGLRLEK